MEVCTNVANDRISWHCPLHSLWQICQRECSGQCQEILSFATFVHTSKESYRTGELELLDECAPTH